MDIINVIVTRNGIVDEIESFAIVDSQLRSEIIEEAENAYMEKIVSIRFEDVTSELADWLRDEIQESWIDEGTYVVGDDVNSIVHLVWSYVENLQTLN